MDIDVFLPHELHTVFRVLRTSLNPSGPLEPAERRFVETYGAMVGGPPLAADPATIAAHDVKVEGAHRRKRLLQLSALAVLLSRPVRPASLDFLDGLAAALETHDPVIDVIRALARGRYRRVRLLAMRRAMRVMAKEAWLAEGAWGVARLFGAMAFKAAVSKDKLWRYKKLGLLPEGSSRSASGNSRST